MATTPNTDDLLEALLDELIAMNSRMEELLRLMKRFDQRASP